MKTMVKNLQYAHFKDAVLSAHTYLISLCNIFSGVKSNPIYCAVCFHAAVDGKSRYSQQDCTDCASTSAS